MSERHSGGLTDEELTAIAEKIVNLMPQNEGCKLTEEQQMQVIELITAKKKVVRWTLYLVGLMVIWVLKDVYYWFAQHITWGK